MNLELIKSKTLWQSVLGAALWAAANALGVVIPVEALLTLIGAVGIKEAAGKIASKPGA